jgi:biotin carboxylase
VLGILEPLQVQLAEVRKALGVAGPSPETADLFRDKARMKDELRRHGLPCARHRLLRTWADAEAFVAEVGLPVVLKPPAGMGCKATWRVRSLEELRGALTAIHAGPENPRSPRSSSAAASTASRRSRSAARSGSTPCRATSPRRSR